MSTEIITLETTPRERTGSRYARRLREAGGIPAIVYGHKMDPESVTLNAKEVVRNITEGHRLFSVALSGGADTVLLKDMQFDHLGRDVIHLDLERVDINERVETKIKLRLKGDAPGLNTAGAILVHPVTELEIICTVGNLEESIMVDVSELEAGETIHASDLDLPHAYELLSDPDSVVASITIVKEEEEETDEAAEGAPIDAAPEVITERKDDEDKDDE